MKWKLITVLLNTFLTNATVQSLLKHSLVADLQGSRFAPGAVQLVQLAESTLCPDAEASNVTTGGKPQEVQLVHVLQSDAFKIQQNNQTHWLSVLFFDNYHKTTAICKIESII